MVDIINDIYEDILPIKIKRRKQIYPNIWEGKNIDNPFYFKEI